MALEPWFKEAIREKPDLFLLAGHMVRFHSFSHDPNLIS
jgi:hypothetical protein